MHCNTASMNPFYIYVNALSLLIDNSYDHTGLLLVASCFIHDAPASQRSVLYYDISDFKSIAVTKNTAGILSLFSRGSLLCLD